MENLAEELEKIRPTLQELASELYYTRPVLKSTSEQIEEIKPVLKDSWKVLEDFTPVLRNSLSVIDEMREVLVRKEEADEQKEISEFSRLSVDCVKTFIEIKKDHKAGLLSAKEAGDMLGVVFISYMNALVVSNKVRRIFGEEAEKFQAQIIQYLQELDKENESDFVANCGVNIEDHPAKNIGAQLRETEDVGLE